MSSETARKAGGRPRKYPEAVSAKHDGAPQLKVRVAPELFAWVQGNGGTAWVRAVLEQMFKESQDTDGRANASRNRKNKH